MLWTECYDGELTMFGKFFAFRMYYSLKILSNIITSRIPWCTNMDFMWLMTAFKARFSNFATSIYLE